MNDQKKSQNPAKIAVAVLVVLAVVAIGALALLSDKIGGKNELEESAKAIEQIAQNDSAPQPGAVGASADGQGSDVPAANTPPEIKPGNPVVAKVNGADVTRMDVLKHVQLLPAELQQLPIDQIFPIARDQVVNARILDQKMEGINLDNDPLFQEQMAAAKTQIEKAVFVQREIEKRLTEDRINEAYQEYVDNFPKVEEVTAKHILVEDTATADEVIAKINAGESFEDLAKQYSKDSTAENGGDLGYFARGDVVKEFGDFAFDNAAGSVSETPVQTQFGYHVIKVGEKRMREPVTLEQAKASLENQLRQKILEEVIADYRANAEVTVFNINGDSESAVEPASGEAAVLESPEEAAPAQ